MKLIKNRENNLGIFTFFCVIALYHFILNCDYGDDIHFRTIINGDDNFFIQLWNYVIFMYSSWGARWLINPIAIILAEWNEIIWKIIDICMWMLSAYSILDIFGKKQDRRFTWVLVFLLLQYPFIDMRSAGWISTTTNYIWPLALGLFSFAIIKRIVVGNEVSVLTYVVSLFSALYCVNQELIGTLFLVASVIALVCSKTVYKTKWKRLLPFCFISVAQLFITLTCPGNESRAIQETAHWFPDFGMYNILDKTHLGITHLVNHFYQEFEIIPFTFFAVLCYAINRKYRQVSLRVISFMPILIYIGHTIIGVCFPTLASYFSPLQLITVYSYSDIFNYIRIALVLFSITLSVALCWILFEHWYESLCMLLILGGGFASSVVMGFSPTVYASGDRTFMFFYFSFIIAILYITDKLEVNSWPKELMFLLSICSIVNTIVYL